MKRSIVLGWFLFIVWPLAAQQTNLKPLLPGAPVPDMVLSDLLQYKKGEEKLSAFKGKVVILAFWSMQCPVCIKAFPLLQHLQEQFRDEVVFMPVSFGATPAAVQAFFDKRRKAGHPISLPTAVFRSHDHALQQLFPTDGYPNMVWIDREGKLVAMTAHLEVTAANIRRLLEGKRPSFASQRGTVPFRRDVPLLLGGNGGPDTGFRYRSLLTGYLKGVGVNAFMRQRDSVATRLLLTNASVAELVRKAVYRGRIKDVFGKLLVLDVADPAQYRLPPADTLFYQRMDSVAYSYELTLPPSFSYEEAYEAMLADLCRYFRITVTQEKRPLRCWVLKAGPGSEKLTSRGGPQVYYTLKEDWAFRVQNTAFSLLPSFLNKRGYPLVVDETGITGNIDMALMVTERAGLKEWNRALEPYGLRLSEEERVVDMLVIREQR